MCPHRGAAHINEFWEEVDGQRIRYLHGGSGPAVLLLHGLLGGSFCWRFTLPALAERHSVYAVDLPGAGLSDTGAATDCSMTAHARRMLHFIEQHKLTDVAVMGCSFGGAVALLLAAMASEHAAANGQRTGSNPISALVLCAPVNPWSQFGRGRIRFLSTMIGGWLLRMAMPVSRPLHSWVLQRLYADTRRIPPGTLDGYRKMILRPGRARNLLNTLRAWSRDVELLQGTVGKIRVPALLLWGGDDRAVDVRSCDELTARLPKSEKVLMSGVGHLPFEEAAEEFNRVVGEFLVRQEKERIHHGDTELRRKP